MLCLLYLPTGQLCKFASRGYTNNILKFMSEATEIYHIPTTVIESIIKRPKLWTGFYARNNLPNNPIKEEFELVNYDILDCDKCN